MDALIPEQRHKMRPARCTGHGPHTAHLDILRDKAIDESRL
jgi:hypothetical protein